MDLDSKRLVLTGASSGIGWALLRQLSRLPVQVVAVAREGTRLREAVDAAGATQDRILPFPCDLARQEEVDRLFAYAVEQMGGIDVFFANAGFSLWWLLHSSAGLVARRSPRRRCDNIPELATSLIRRPNRPSQPSTECDNIPHIDYHAPETKIPLGVDNRHASLPETPIATPQESSHELDQANLFPANACAAQ